MPRACRPAKNRSGIADRGDPMHTLARERSEPPRLRRAGDRDRDFADEPHRNLVGLRARAVADAKIDAVEPIERLAQRTGGQQMLVAETALAVDHADLDVACERWILQAVVGDDDVRAMTDEQRRGFGTVAARPQPVRRCAGA